MKSLFSSHVTRLGGVCPKDLIAKIQIKHFSDISVSSPIPALAVVLIAVQSRQVLADLFVRSLKKDLRIAEFVRVFLYRHKLRRW